MKKYIRTIDGTIIDLSNKEIDINARNDIVFEDNTYIPEEYIVKVDDNLEKLCDELYFVEDETNIPWIVNRLHDFDEDKKLTECCLEIGGWITWLKSYSKKGCIKGAIFTSRGIIYVTKMNEIGDFELL